jgi:hypothetical protein
MLKPMAFGVLAIWGICSLVWGPSALSKIEEQFDDLQERTGRTVEACSQQDGSLELVSAGLFGGTTKTMCLLPNGETFLISFN